MTTLEFTQENWPTPDEFQRMVQDALAKSNPVDDLLELAEELRRYEQQYGMSSEKFFRLLQQGELGDALDFIDWAGAYHLFLDRKARVEATLMQAAIWQRFPLEQPLFLEKAETTLA